jgi:hypothetical protein
MSLPGMLGWVLGGVLLAAGGCWPEVTLANRKSEIRTTIRSRMTKSPILGVPLLLTLSQERCFSKGMGLPEITEVTRNQPTSALTFGED